MAGPWEDYGGGPDGPWKDYSTGDGKAEPEKPMSWGEVGVSALEHTPESAVNTVKSMATPILHPIDTAKNLYHTAIGEAEKIGHVKGQDQAYADALNSYFINRYGSAEGFKTALAKDPVGVATDVSALFGGGEAALSKATGTLGKVGEVAGKVSRATNPIELAAKGAGLAKKAAVPVGKEAATVIGSLGTHTGGESLRLAAQAGYFGGDASKEFLDNMRGDAPIEDVLESAKKAVTAMRTERGAAYRAGMHDVAQDKTVLDFAPIDKAMADATKIKTFKGIDISPATKQVRSDITGMIDEWKKLNPAEYHTPEGLDALKQQIGEYREGLEYGTPSRSVADAAYHAVWTEIKNQAPKYAEVMKDYQTASEELDQIKKTLSINPKASIDTSLRKLQSVMRDNVNTSYGYRTKLANKLVEHGATNLKYQLAGQALAPQFPRGLGRYEAGIPIALSALHGNPAPLAALPLMSPRLMGEAAHGAGAAARLGKKIPAVPQGATNLAPYLYEVGSLSDAINRK